MRNNFLSIASGFGFLCVFLPWMHLIIYEKYNSSIFYISGLQIPFYLGYINIFLFSINIILSTIEFKNGIIQNKKKLLIIISAFFSLFISVVSFYLIEYDKLIGLNFIKNEYLNVLGGKASIGLFGSISASLFSLIFCLRSK